MVRDTFVALISGRHLLCTYDLASFTSSQFTHTHAHTHMSNFHLCPGGSSRGAHVNQMSRWKLKSARQCYRPALCHLRRAQL